MSLAVQALQIATVAALEQAQVSAKIFDSLVDPKELTNENTVIAVVSVVEGRLNTNAKDLFGMQQTVDLCVDLGIARKVSRTVTQGEVETVVEFPDNGAGHDIVLRTTAYEMFRALQASNALWPSLWRDLWVRHDKETPSHWERGVAADKGTRLGILRYTLKLELLDDPTPGLALEPGSTWDTLLNAMADLDGLEPVAALWRDLIEKPALPDWRVVQSALGLSLAAARATGFAPIDGSEEPEGEGAAVAASTIEGEDKDTGVVVSVTSDDPDTEENEAAAERIDGDDTAPLVEVPPQP